MIQVERQTADQIDSSTSAILTSATLFSSTGFADIWKTLGGRPVVWIARENSAIVAMLPGVEFGSGPAMRFQAMPDGCYAKMICSSREVNSGESAEAIAGAVARFGYAKAYIYDFSGAFHDAKDWQRQVCSTHLVEIDQDWDPPDATLRSEIRKAEREGVVVEQFNASRDLASYIELDQETARRQGRRRKYPDRFYTALAGLSLNDERVVWLVVRFEGRLVASHLDFIVGDMLLNWQVVSSRDYPHLKANQLLLFQATKLAAKMGVKYLNLGASPDDAEALLSYKRKWGGVDRTYDCLIHRNLLGKLLR